MSKASALASCAAAESPAQEPITASMMACIFSFLMGRRVYRYREVRGCVGKMVGLLSTRLLLRTKGLQELEKDYVAVLLEVIIPNRVRSPPETQRKRVEEGRNACQSGKARW